MAILLCFFGLKHQFCIFLFESERICFWFSLVLLCLNCVGHSSFYYNRVDWGGYELGEFGVEQLDKEQNEVCENSLNNYPLKKFHLIGRWKLVGVGHDLLTKKRSYCFKLGRGFWFEDLCISGRGWREKRAGKTIVKNSTTRTKRRGDAFLPVKQTWKVGSWDMTSLE